MGIVNLFRPQPERPHSQMDRFETVPQPADNMYRILVTPELAIEWLDSDTHNRPASDDTIEKYARDMTAKRWRETGETITWTGKFVPEPPYLSPGAILLNGGHRLRAAVEGDAAFPAYVGWEIPFDGQERTDTGRKRTHGEQLGLRGEVNSMLLSAAIRRLHGWEEGRRQFNSYTSARVSTDSELDAILLANPGLRDAVREAMNHKTEGLSGSLLSLCWFLFSRIDEVDCETFFTRLSKGLELTSDSPIWHLKNKLRELDQTPGRVPEGLVLAFVIKAWNQFRDGQKVRLFKMILGGASPEPYPEPH